MENCVETSKATGQIKIIKEPQGSAPSWVRKASIGLTLPCHPFAGPPDHDTDRDVVSDKKVELNNSFVSVPQDAFISALKQAGQYAAARWWEERDFGKPDTHFGFEEDEIEIISGVQRKTIRMHPEEGVGSHDFRP